MADFAPAENQPSTGRPGQQSQQTGSQIRQAFYDLAQRTISQTSSSGETVIDMSRPEVRNLLPHISMPQSMGMPPGPNHAHAHSHSFQQRAPHGQSEARPGGGDQNHNGSPPSLLQYVRFERAGPFVVLLLIKLMYDHRLGILLLSGLFGTFHYANRKLEVEIFNTMSRDNRQRQSGQSKLTILWIVALMVINILAIYYVFSDEQLYRSLYLRLPVVETVDFWTLVWVVGITDFTVKFITVAVKGCVSIIPQACLSPRKRGKYYVFLEQTSQLYRSVLVTRPWLHYLADFQHIGKTMSVILVLVYLLLKANVLYGQFKEFLKAFRKLAIDMVFGTKPSRDEMKESGDTCPICQDDYRDPVKLTCKHIFCEDCVSIWFDREKTCPMCRAQIADNPTWKNGSTSADVQWY